MIPLIMNTMLFSRLKKDSNVGAVKFSVENIISDGDNEKTIIVNHVMNIVNDENNNNNNGSD